MISYSACPFAQCHSADRPSFYLVYDFSSIYITPSVSTCYAFFSSEKVAESRVVLFLETEDIEAAVSKAVSAGAVVESKIADSDGPYVGNRVAKLKDPFGFTWLIGTPAKESPVGEV